MKCFDQRLGLARSLLAFSLAFALVLSSHVLAFASPDKSSPRSGLANVAQSGFANRELQINSATATATKDGVLLHWSTSSVSDNLGFNVYRIVGNERVRANREIIPGALFAPGTPALMPGYSYSWFDRGGSANCSYVIESVSVDGGTKLHQSIKPVASKTLPAYEQAPETLNDADPNATETTDHFEKQYPAEEMRQEHLSSGPLQQQWDIAGQTALKIGVKKDGWYRVTQPQMVAAGFNPTVDIKSLHLFTDATEVAINTSQASGQFGSGDFIEFYGRGLDVPTTDTRTYYLIAETAAGKRVGGELKLDGDQVLPLVPAATPAAARGPVLRDRIFYSWIQYDVDWIYSLASINQPARRTGREPGSTDAANAAPLNPEGDQPTLDSAPRSAGEQPPTAALNRNTAKSMTLAGKAPAIVAKAASAGTTLQPAPRQQRQQLARKHPSTKRGSKRGQALRTEHNHALLSDRFAVPNFDSTVQLKDRRVYLSNLLNGDEENFFGAVIGSLPVSLTLSLPNPDPTAARSATLEFALQGVMSQAGNNHQVSVSFNNTPVGVVDFGPLEHPVRSFSIPANQILNGANTVKFTKTSTGEVSIVDYVRLTYPHIFKADNGALKFNLRGSQTLKVDGFAVPSVRLLDYTDPFNVSITKPDAETSASGYAITVPMSESRSKAQRLLYAIPDGQFDQPATLSLNQPSTLNLTTNAADFLIIAYRDLIPALTPLVNQRHDRDGFTVQVVDIEDVYDEFSYGVHGPQAIKSFLQHAKTNWATPPRYVIFAGDASLDPRNYQNVGNFDLVPTKLVDATYSEACSDDWLTDFDNDGVGDIPVGRLPFRTLADANLLVSKIVNFAPANVPQSALMVADQDEFNIYGFATTNDVFQGLVQGSLSVQRLNRAPQPAGVPAQSDSQVRDGIINGFNQGRALVNYSGHGNIDVWTGASLFVSADALALTNANRLSFVVVMDCLNGYFQDPQLLSLSEALLKAPNGGAVAAFASSGLTIAQGQHEMGRELYTQLYGNSPITLGDAIKIAKGATFDIDVKRTWIFFGDPSLKIR